MVHTRLERTLHSSNCFFDRGASLYGVCYLSIRMQCGGVILSAKAFPYFFEAEIRVLAFLHFREAG